MSSGESHDQSELNSSAEEVLKTTPPGCDGMFLGGYPDERSAQNVHRTSDVFQRTADSGRHHLVSRRKAVTHKCVREEVETVNDPCLFFCLHACPLVDRTTHCSFTASLHMQPEADCGLKLSMSSLQAFLGDIRDVGINIYNI